MAEKKPDEFRKFTQVVDTILSVPKSEIDRREREYQERAAKKPKRGPKPKRTS
jgi:hypothetical protein